MSGNLKKLFKYKAFYVILIITIILLPTTLYMPSQAQSRAIVTAIGIDKVDNLYEVTLAMITPKNSGQVAGGNMVDSGMGNSVSIAMQNLSINLGKIIGLQHCSFIIISDEVFQEDITGVLDYFIRTNNLTADAHLINCTTSAKKLIEEGASASESSVATMNDIIQFNNDYLYSEAVTIYEFYNRHLSESGSVFVPILELKGSESGMDSTESASGDDNSNMSSSNTSDNNSSSSASGSTANSSKYKSNGKCAIIKNGKKIREISENERVALNILNEGKGNSVISVEDYSEGDIVDADMYYQLVEKSVSTKGTIENGVPKITFKIRLLVKLDEIHMYGVDASEISSLTSYMSSAVESKLKQNLHGYIMELTNNMKNDNTDILFIYDKLNRFHHKEFKKYLSNLSDDNYLNGIQFDTDIEIRSKI